MHTSCSYGMPTAPARTIVPARTRSHLGGKGARGSVCGKAVKESIALTFTLVVAHSQLVPPPQGRLLLPTESSVFALLLRIFVSNNTSSSKLPYLVSFSPSL
jgi:hypothetical protein